MTRTSASRPPATLIGHDLLAKLKSLTLDIYARGSAHAASRGIMLADTKFEFGLVERGGEDGGQEIILIDEVMTPDSSRFWPADTYAPGGAQPSFDKQFVRDYLESIKWNKQPPVPSLPEDVVERTRAKVPRRVPPPDGPRAGSVTMRAQLEALVREMVDKGILYDDARREFERRYILYALENGEGNIGQHGRADRHAPQHPVTQNCRIQHQAEITVHEAPLPGFSEQHAPPLDTPCGPLIISSRPG